MRWWSLCSTSCCLQTCPSECWLGCRTSLQVTVHTCASSEHDLQGAAQCTHRGPLDPPQAELCLLCQPPIPCRGKPLREFDAQRTGREWRRPSATTEIKVGRG